MMYTKELLIALGLAWLVMALVGCSSGGSSRPLLGDHGGQYVEHRDGTVQNLQTGEIGVRRGAWVQDLKTGRLQFTYGNFIEETPRSKSEERSGGRSR